MLYTHYLVNHDVMTANAFIAIRFPTTISIHFYVLTIMFM